MKALVKYVIPRIAHKWRTVADFLDYDDHMSTIDIIAEKHRDDCVKCCDGLLRDWLTTDRGAAPKTWNTLIKALKEIDELHTAVSEMERDLKKLFMLYPFV